MFTYIRHNNFQCTYFNSTDVSLKSLVLSWEALRGFLSCRAQLKFNSISSAVKHEIAMKYQQYSRNNKCTGYIYIRIEKLFSTNATWVEAVDGLVIACLFFIVSILAHWSILRLKGTLFSAAQNLAWQVNLNIVAIVLTTLNLSKRKRMLNT